MSQILQNIDLAPLTAFGVGGQAENYLAIKSYDDFLSWLKQIDFSKPYHILGSATNSLISDQGLDGTVIHFIDGQIQFKNNQLIADSGVNWDYLVEQAIKHNLWGIELMSGIPGTVGGAVAININAYGQALSDTLSWVEVYNPQNQQLEKIPFKKADWDYKKSPFSNSDLIILRAALNLKPTSATKLNYPSALLYAQKHNLNPNNLKTRRQIILSVRAKAGSLLNQEDKSLAKTCGSFFRNPVVDQTQLNQLLSFDETKINIDQLKTMNQIHGGQTNRISAAHVLLAAGFKRGQTFKRVRLHPDHVLKIENYDNATALEIYQLAKHIAKTVKIKLNINLEFEVNTLGRFE